MCENSYTVKISSSSQLKPVELLEKIRLANFGSWIFFRLVLRKLWKKLFLKLRERYQEARHCKDKSNSAFSSSHVSQSLSSPSFVLLQRHTSPSTPNFLVPSQTIFRPEHLTKVVFKKKTFTKNRNEQSLRSNVNLKVGLGLPQN